MPGGHVERWNRVTGDILGLQMKPGDRIVEANGIRNDVRGILNECSQSKKLELVVQPLRVNRAILLGNALGDGGAVELANGVPSGKLESLRRLNLGHCGIMDDGAKALASAMEEGGMPLARLSLEDNDIGDEGAAAIARAVRSGGVPELRCLDLEDNQIGNSGARALAEAVTEAPELRELWVRGNAFQNAGRDALRNAWAPRDPANLWF
jgi:Ran GTPase-activating protein (RanGAP) involved in mRNA processing and transport